jgi:hypothetical protein
MVAKGLTVREAATRLKIGKTALYAAFRICADPAAQSQARIGQPHGSDLA